MPPKHVACEKAFKLDGNLAVISVLIKPTRQCQQQTPRRQINMESLMEIVFTWVLGYTASHRSGDDGTWGNNKYLYNPPPNRNHIVRQAQRLRCRILIVAVLQI